MSVSDIRSPSERCYVRLIIISNRYSSARRRAGVLPGFKPPRMPQPDRYKMREWFEGWYVIIQEDYRREINKADNIIGKQWLYDNRPKFPL